MKPWVHLDQVHPIITTPPTISFPQGQKRWSLRASTEISEACFFSFRNTNISQCTHITCSYILPVNHITYIYDMYTHTYAHAHKNQKLKVEPNIFRWIFSRRETTEIGAGLL